MGEEILKGYLGFSMLKAFFYQNKCSIFVRWIKLNGLCPESMRYKSLKTRRMNVRFLGFSLRKRAFIHLNFEHEGAYERYPLLSSFLLHLCIFHTNDDCSLVLQILFFSISLNLSYQTFPNFLNAWRLKQCVINTQFTSLCVVVMDNFHTNQTNLLVKNRRENGTWWIIDNCFHR